MRKSIAAGLLAVFASFPAAQLKAAVIPPIGLAPGSQYQLVFVTADARDATSTTEAPYNAFVTAQAALGLSSGVPATTWNAITSTLDGTDASVNAPWLGVPVYNTAGIEVTLTSQSLYVGFLQHPITYNQFGLNTAPIEAYTGSGPTGQGFPSFTMGSAQSAFGNPPSVQPSWIIAGTTFSVQQHPLYALSGLLTVPAPEPSTFALAALGLAGLAAWSWRRKRPSNA